MNIEALQSADKAKWTALADQAKARAETGLFIDGDFVDATEGGRFESINPANGEIIAEMSMATEKDVDRAVESAKKSYKSGAWSRRTPRDRMHVMYRFAALVDEHADELSVLETMDMGKPISEVLGDDLPAVVACIQFMGECIDKIEGRVANTEDGVLHFVSREPYGVVGAISPWNYPLLMATWKIAPALAAGNSVVLKPAEQAPLSCLRLAQLFVEAGGPSGVFNVINGMGDVAGKALALHNDVSKVSFTGSTEVGKLILQYAGQSNMKKVSLECGGKSPQIFLSDLENLDEAVAAAYDGIYGNMGQVCNAASRLLVDRKILDAFVERFVAEGRNAYVPGDPLDPATNLGPLVTKGAQARVLGYVDKGKSEGAKLEFGGDVPDTLRDGAFVSPALFTGVTNAMTIAREEIFGPVASVIPFDTIDEAVTMANDTIYGLAASVWTRDINKALRLTKKLESGIVWVNTFNEMDQTMPFGGYKQSGNAKDNCMESVVSYTQEKSAWIRINH